MSILVNGKRYKEVPCTNSCKGCDFFTKASIRITGCKVRDRYGCFEIIYKREKMDFDIKKVIGPLDISRAVVGHKYYFSDKIENIVLCNNIAVLGCIRQPDYSMDFPYTTDDETSVGYRYIYPCEQKYVPFTMDDAESIIGKVVRHKEDGYIQLLTCMYEHDGVVTINDLTSDFLLRNYTFLDGSPCGRKAR